MKRYILSAVFVFVLAGLIVWRLGLNHKAAAAQLEQRQQAAHAKPLVNVAVASYKDIQESFEAVGDVESPTAVNIAPKYAGPVEFVGAVEGQHVTKGQVLIKIDPAEAQANVSQQEANVAQAEEHLAQAQLTQNPNDVGVTSTIRQDQATVFAAQANLNAAEKNYLSQVASAESAVTDAQSKVAAAQAQVVNSQAGIRSAQANQVDGNAKYSREAVLLAKGYVAAQDTDDAKAALGVDNAAVDVANAELNASQSAESSAAAELKSAQDQADIARETYRAAVDSAKANVAEAKAALATALANTAQKPAYIANLDALQAAVTAAKAELHDAQVQLQYTVLTSPIDGWVTARLCDPGTQATAGQELLQVQLINRVWVTAPIPEEQAEDVHVGQDASVTLDSLPGQRFRARVTTVNASANPASRAFDVRVTIDNPKSLIKPGMFARVDFVTQVFPHQVYVPREAINFATGSPSTALVVDPSGTAHLRLVTVSCTDTDGFGISQGISAGDQVITLSALPITDGQAVRIAGQGKSGGSGHHGRHHGGGQPPVS